MYSSEPIGPGAANHEGMPRCASLKDTFAASVRFPFRVFLIQNEVLQIQNAKLFQRALAFLGVRTFGKLRFCLCNQPFQIGCHNQTRAFLINLRNAIVEWCCSEAACLALLQCCWPSPAAARASDWPQTDPFESRRRALRFLAWLSSGCRGGQWILNETDRRPSLCSTGFLLACILRYLLLEKLLEALQSS